MSRAVDAAALAFAHRVSARQPRNDYTIAQLPVGGNVQQTDLLAAFRNGATVSVLASSFQQPLSDVVTVFNVMDYGAVGNGVANDTAAVAAANAALVAGGIGGVLFFPAGTYALSTGTPIHSGTCVMGQGRGISILKMLSTFVPHAGAYNGSEGLLELDLCDGGVYSGLASNITIQDLTFDLTQSPASSIYTENYFGIHQAWTTVQHLRVMRCDFLCNAFAIGCQLEQIVGTSNGHAWDLCFEDIYCLNGSGTINLYSEATNADSVQSWVSDIKIDGVWNYINTVVSDDRILLGFTQIYGFGLAEKISVQNVYVWIDNSVTGGTINGVHYDIGNVNLRDLVVRNVFFRGSSSATVSAGNLPNGTGYPLVGTFRAGATYDNLTFDTLEGVNSRGFYVPYGPTSVGSKLTIENCSIVGGLDVYSGLTITATQAPTGKELITIRNCSFSTAVTCQQAILLSGAASGNGFSGLTVIDSCEAVNYGYAVATNVSPSGASVTYGWTNISVLNSLLVILTAAFLNLGGLVKRLANNAGYNPFGQLTFSQLTNGATFASNTVFHNYSGVDVTVYINGGTVSAVLLNNINITPTTTLIMPAGSYASITYSAAPTLYIFGN